MNPSFAVLTNWKDKIAIKRCGEDCGESNLELEIKSFGHIKIEVYFTYPSCNVKLAKWVYNSGFQWRGLDCKYNRESLGC